MLRRRERPRLRLSRGSRVRHLPGSGIGLALVRTVARRLGGEVNLRARRVATPNFLGDGGRHAAGHRCVTDGGHPVQVPLGHHRNDTFAAQPSRQQRSPEPVGTDVELPIGPLLVAEFRRDGVRVRLHPLLEQLMHTTVREVHARSREPLELHVELLGGEQALPAVLGIRIGGDQRERRKVIANDPGRVVGVDHVRPVPQTQYDLIAVMQDPHP